MMRAERVTGKNNNVISWDKGGKKRSLVKIKKFRNIAGLPDLKDWISIHNNDKNSISFSSILSNKHAIIPTFYVLLLLLKIHVYAKDFAESH